MKPFYVRKLKDRNTCCCEYHVQAVYINKDAFNNMRQGRYGLHGGFCQCRCEVCVPAVGGSTCAAANSTFQSLTALWESILCPKPENSMFHLRKCLIGKCDQCGTKRLPCCPREVQNDNFMVTVKVFVAVEMQEMDEDGQRKKRKDFAIQQIGCCTFISLMKDKLTKFIQHNYIYRWQADQFRECLQNFPDDVVVSVVDFAENYSFKIQNEIQSMHWYSSQVSILVHICYVRSAMGDIQKTLHFYISDDNVHDTLFVQHCFLLHDQWLKDHCFNLKRHWVWSDGAASQFKARRPFYFVARYFQLTGLEMMHNYFGSGHGKGEHDGAGAVIKRALTHEQLKVDGETLHNAASVVEFLTVINNKKSDWSSLNKVDRVFWEIKVGDVSRDIQWDCMRLSGSRSLHCVNGFSSSDTTALRCRNLSCFCHACVHGQWRRCANKAHVEAWQYLKIQPKEATIYEDAVSSDEEIDAPIYAGHHDDLSDALRVGDNFAVNAEEKDSDFYILKCCAEKKMSTTNEKDAWHNRIKKNSCFVEGHFYDRVKGHSDRYRLLYDKPPASMYSHLIRCLKFPLFPIEGEPNVYTMSDGVYEHIYNSMPSENMPL